MKDLIDRLQKATGPDRSIDLDIARMEGVTVLRRNDDDTANEEYTYHRYTECLDSAMTLVPPGLMVTMTILGNKASVSVKTGSIINPETKEWQAHGFTPAAISAAALKARAALRLLPTSDHASEK